MMTEEAVLTDILKRVQKPARYLGNEWNSILKDHNDAAARMVFAFPDLYEVGMSNQGLKILYESVNSCDDLLMERVFAPAPDMESEMRERGFPLFALESGRPVRDFDLVGFSLQYEMSYTNVLNMLDLAGIALYSDERSESDPLVIGGGPCCYNPEPLALFFDIFLLGESEDALPEVMRRLGELNKKNLRKKDILLELSSITGVYIPGFYKPLYLKNDDYAGLEKVEAKAPARIMKRHIDDLDISPYPVAPIVPYIQVVHDRAVAELFRGCARGCRFCQAGFIFRPIRKRSPGRITEICKAMIENTGYDELSLSSLSSSDYPNLDELVETLEKDFGSQVRLSLPSLRLDSYSINLADRLHRGKRSSLTFAPEAATERMRRVIKKNLTENDIFTALEDAVNAGWQGFKLYFMIGLPTERDEDVIAIADLTRTIRDNLKKKAGGALKISVSVATFVPKANTPFQWEPQISLCEIKRRQRLLQDSFQQLRGIDLSWHDAETSYLEAIFARGDRRLAVLLEQAWRLGCRFDGWSEHFSFARWLEALSISGISGERYSGKRYSYEDVLPWDHLECGMPRDYFVREHRAALETSGESEVF